MKFRKASDFVNSIRFNAPSSFALTVLRTSSGFFFEKRDAFSKPAPWITPTIGPEFFRI